MRHARALAVTMAFVFILSRHPNTALELALSCENMEEQCSFTFPFPRLDGSVTPHPDGVQARPPRSWGWAYASM